MANKVDYENLKQAKTNVENRFDEMLKNLEETKNKILNLTGESWKGQSANYFSDVFDEMNKKIVQERNEFSNEMKRKLDLWYAEFSDAEKALIDAASKIE